MKYTLEKFHASSQLRSCTILPSTRLYVRTVQQSVPKEKYPQCADCADNNHLHLLNKDDSGDGTHTKMMNILCTF